MRDPAEDTEDSEEVQAVKQKGKAELLYKLFVGLSIPVILGIYFNWLDNRDTIGDLQHEVEKLQIQHESYVDRLKILEDWKEEGDRFTSDDGLELGADIIEIRRSCSIAESEYRKHNLDAQEHISSIRENRGDIAENHSDIKDLQKYHSYTGNNKR